MPGPGLQVALEMLRLGALGERHIGGDLPGPGLAGVDRVLIEASAQIVRDAALALARHCQALKQIHIVHGWPCFAEASKGILLRDELSVQSCEARESEAGWRRGSPPGFELRPAQT